MAGECLVAEHAEAVAIGPGIDGRPGHRLFRCHVGEGAHHRIGAGEPGHSAEVVPGLPLGDAEVGNAHPPATIVAEQVFRFDIPVNQTLGMGVGEGSQHLVGHSGDPLRLKRRGRPSASVISLRRERLPARSMASQGRS